MTDNAIKILQNFAAKNVFAARYINTVNVLQTPDFCRVDCGLLSDTFNVSVPFTNQPTPKLYSQMVDYFSLKQAPMALWLWDFLPNWRSFLNNAPITFAETNLAMHAHLAELDTQAETPPELNLQRVKTPRDIAAFAGVLAGIFGKNAEAHNVKRYFNLLAATDCYTDGTALLYFGSVNGNPVCTGAAFPYRDTVGIYDIATLPGQRNRGYGSAMFSHILRDLKKHFHCLCVLQASPYGAGIYKKAGFKPVCEVFVYESHVK